MSSPFSLRLYVHDVGRADAFDKCTIPKTNGHDNWQSFRSSVLEAQNGKLWVLRFSVEVLSEVDFGAESGELCVWRVSVEPSFEVDFGAQSGELCVWRVSVEPSLEVDFGAQSGEL